MTEPAYTPLGALRDWLASLLRLFSDPDSPFWWPTLVMILIGIVVFVAVSHTSWRRLRGEAMPEGWRPYLKELPWDVGLMLANSSLLFFAAPVLMAAMLVGSMLGSLIPVPIFGVPGTEPVGEEVWSALFCAFMALLGMDFMRYWTHVLFHRVPALWRLHHKHHEPRVLTPITAFRFWPLEQIVHLLGAFFGTGFGIGFAATVLGGTITLYTLFGVNVFVLLWNIGFSHLRHSPIALSFPRWLSFILVSPLMHQAHHSVDPAQHDRNYATVFAFWDWMFGTLYLTRPDERFRFGVDDAARERLSAPPSAPGPG